MRKKSPVRKRFPGIPASAFQHTADRESMKKLARLPGMQILLRKLSSSYLEKTVRMLNVSQNVKVTPKQFPKIHNMFREACEVLDLKEIPDIYVSTNPNPNAFSFGIDRYTVLLLSGLIDMLNEEELLFVVGHELTHIKCDHMMYKTLLYVLTYLGVEVFGMLFKVAAITFFPLEMALRSWERKAEFSCDRGGLLVVQDRDIVEKTMLKLAGSARSLLPELSIKEVLKQADELKDMDDELFVRAMKMYHTAFRSHPFPIIRIKELHNWSQSNQFRKILDLRY